MIFRVARYGSTPIPMVEEMEGDDVIAYHAAAMRLLEAEQPSR